MTCICGLIELDQPHDIACPEYFDPATDKTVGRKYEEIEVKEDQLKFSTLITSLERMNSRLTEENERLVEENKRLRKELDSRPVFDAKTFTTGPTSNTMPQGYMFPSELRQRLENDLRNMSKKEVKK